MKRANKWWQALSMPPIEKNYFLSWWIANLGVVPLFFMAFLRAAPILFLVFALLVFVTRVLETILNLLLNHVQNKPLVLSEPSYPVKAFLGLFLILLPLKSHSLELKEDKDLILARGEQMEISLPGGMAKFSIGNGEVISRKLLKNKLLIKGKSVGFSDLKLWQKNGKEQHFRVYVLSKSDQLNSLQLAEAVKNLDLKLTVSGAYILVEGEIDRFEDYLLLKKILVKNQDILLSVSLSRSLKSKLIGEIYEVLFKENLDSFQCKAHYLNLECRYSEEQKISDSSQKFLREKYLLELIPTRDMGRNLKIKLKMIQLERLDGKELSFGLGQLSSKVQDFFDQGLMSLVNQNLILLRNHNIHASTLAEPELLSVMGEESKVEIGSEIPFRADALNAINTQWKFAGLRLKFTLLPHGKDIKLKYETEFTRPQEGTITGSKNQALIHIKKGQSMQIFQIVFKTETIEKTGIPILENIPLLGEIFKSKSNVSTYKSITGILLVEENS